MTFDIAGRIAELVAMGVPAELAGTIAGNELVKLQTELSKVQEEARKTAEQSAGIVDWNGIKVRFKPGQVRPSSGYTVAVSSGAAIEPANVGVDAKTGANVLWPPSYWIAAEGRTMLSLTQQQCVTLHTMISKVGADKFAASLEMIAGPAALKAYDDEKAAKEASGEITSRNKRKTVKA